MGPIKKEAWLLEGTNPTSPFPSNQSTWMGRDVIVLGCFLGTLIFIYLIYKENLKLRKEIFDQRTNFQSRIRNLEANSNNTTTTNNQIILGDVINKVQITIEKKYEAIKGELQEKLKEVESNCGDTNEKLEKDRNLKEHLIRKLFKMHSIVKELIKKIEKLEKGIRINGAIASPIKKTCKFVFRDGDDNQNSESNGIPLSPSENGLSLSQLETEGEETQPFEVDIEDIDNEENEEISPMQTPLATPKPSPVPEIKKTSRTSDKTFLNPNRVDAIRVTPNVNSNVLSGKTITANQQIPSNGKANNGLQPANETINRDSTVSVQEGKTNTSSKKTPKTPSKHFTTTTSTNGMIPQKAFFHYDKGGAIRLKVVKNGSHTFDTEEDNGSTR